MPVVYVPGDGSYYVTDDGLGHVTKQKIGGIDPTQEPGYVRQTASNSTSSSTSQSIADPQTIQLQRDTLAQQIAQADVQNAQWQQQYEFTKDKARVEEERGNKQLAIQQSQLAETINGRIQQGMLAREAQAADLTRLTLTQQFQAAQQQQQQAYQSGENAASRTAQANEGIASRNLTREQMMQSDRQQREAQGLQRDTAIANAASNPGDVGVVSAWLNRGGLSNLSTAIGSGETAITDRSLEPLASLLNPLPALPQYAMETPQTPIQQAMSATGQPTAAGSQSFNGDAAKAIIAALQGGATAATGGAPAALPGAPQYNAANSGANAAQNNAIAAAQAAGSTNGGWQATPGFEDGGAVVDQGTIQKLLSMVQMMGMQPKAIAGERGQANGETVYSNGDVVVVPDKGKGLPQMEDGGVVGNDLLQRAWDFMSNVGNTALDRSGFGTAPTPVSLADPGTSAYRRTLGAATTAAVKGVPQSAFLEELMKAVPMGMNRTAYGRTR